MFLKTVRKVFSRDKTKKSDPKADQPIYEVVGNHKESIYHGPEGEYEEIDCPGSTSHIPVRRIDACQMNENQGKIRTIITLKQQSQVLLEERSICEALTLTDIDDLIIGGKLSNKGCSILTNIVRCDSMKIDNAVISCSLDWLIQLLQRTKEAEFVNCSFEDAQLICDELFIKNPQLIRLKILHNSRKYSFPLMTDGLLRFWTQQKQDYNIQLRAETSFTTRGIQYLTQMLLGTPFRSNSMYLGKIASDSDTCKKIKMPSGLQLDCKGRRFFIKDVEGRLFVSFDTSITRLNPLLSGNEPEV